MQVSQQDMFKHVLNDPLLGSSIYINIALAGLTLLVLAYMARDVVDPRAKLIVVSVMSVSAVSFDRAFLAAGRFSVTVATSPSVDTVTLASSMRVPSPGRRITVVSVTA